MMKELVSMQEKEGDEIIECIMCKLSIYKSFQIRHFRYQHMIQEDWLIKHIIGLRPPDKARKKRSVNGQVSDKPESVETNVNSPESTRNDRVQNSPSQISKIRLRREQSEEGNEVLRIQTPLPPLKINLTPPSNKQPTVRPLLIKTSPASKILSPPKGSPPGKTPGQLKLKIKAQNGVMTSELRSGEKVDDTTIMEKDHLQEVSVSGTNVSTETNEIVKRKRGRPPKMIKPDSTQSDFDKPEIENSSSKDTSSAQQPVNKDETEPIRCKFLDLYKYRCSKCQFKGYQKMSLLHHSCTQSPQSSKSSFVKQRMEIQLDNVNAYRTSENKSYVIQQIDWTSLSWSPGDASLPEDWLVARHIDKLGASTQVFLSPNKQIFTDREEIAAYLVSSGEKISVMDGYRYTPSPDQENIETNYVYKSGDPNSVRKKGNFKFQKSGMGKVRTKVSNQTTFTQEEEVKYGRPRDNNIRCSRILLLDPPPGVDVLHPAAAADSNKKVEKEANVGTRDAVVTNFVEDEIKNECPIVDKKRKHDDGEAVTSRKPDHKNDDEVSLVKRLRRSSGAPPPPSSPPKQVVQKKEVRKGKKVAESTLPLHVKCCNPKCKIWRKTRQYKDSAEVPEFWICSMNPDPDNNECGVGGEDHSASDNVTIKFNRGDLVWGKLKGYPWWPAMIDLSPQSAEFYWMDEDISETEPARYNLIFFEKTNELSSAWILAENIRKDKHENIKSNIVLKQPVKETLNQAYAMIDSARNMTVEQRLEEFSYLKIGATDSEGEEEELEEGNNQSGRYTKKIIQSSRRPAIKKFATPHVSDTNNGVTRSKQGSRKQLDVPESEPTSCLPEKTVVVAPPVIAVKSAPPPPPVVQDRNDIKVEQMFTNSNVLWEKIYQHPSLPQDVLITLAVINLDPKNHHGAACKKIVAFLSMHFPYFNRNIEECKKLVRMAHNIKPEEETGNENFRIKVTLMPRLKDRLNQYVNKSREIVKDALIFPDLMEHIMKADEEEKVGQDKCRPPNNLKMLLNLAMINLYPPFTADQAALLFAFIFPAFEEEKDRPMFQDCDIVHELTSHPNLTVVTGVKQEKFFLLQPDAFSDILHEVESFFSDQRNYHQLTASIRRIEYIKLLLPGLKVSNSTNDAFSSKQSGVIVANPRQYKNSSAASTNG